MITHLIPAKALCTVNNTSLLSGENITIKTQGSFKLQTNYNSSIEDQPITPKGVSKAITSDYSKNDRVLAITAAGLEEGLATLTYKEDYNASLKWNTDSYKITPLSVYTFYSGLEKINNIPVEYLSQAGNTLALGNDTAIIDMRGDTTISGGSLAINNEEKGEILYRSAPNYNLLSDLHLASVGYVKQISGSLSSAEGLVEALYTPANTTFSNYSAALGLQNIIGVSGLRVINIADNSSYNKSKRISVAIEYEPQIDALIREDKELKDIYCQNLITTLSNQYINLELNQSCLGRFKVVSSSLDTNPNTDQFYFESGEMICFRAENQGVGEETEIVYVQENVYVHQMTFTIQLINTTETLPELSITRVATDLSKNEYLLNPLNLDYWTWFVASSTEEACEPEEWESNQALIVHIPQFENEEVKRDESTLAIITMPMQLIWQEGDIVTPPNAQTITIYKGAFAEGVSNLAIGNSTFVTGNNNKGFGENVVVFGENNIAYTHSFVAGQNNYIVGETNFCFGANNTISVNDNTVLGNENTIDGGQFLFILGNNNQINGGETNLVLGHNNLITDSALENNILLGHNLSTSSTKQQIILGQYNDNNSLADLIIGAGTENTNRRNALQLFNEDGHIEVITPAGDSDQGDRIATLQWVRDRLNEFEESVVVTSKTVTLEDSNGSGDKYILYIKDGDLKIKPQGEDTI